MKATTGPSFFSLLQFAFGWLPDFSRTPAAAGPKNQKSYWNVDDVRPASRAPVARSMKAPRSKTSTPKCSACSETPAPAGTWSCAGSRV